MTQKIPQREEEGSADDPSPCLDSLFIEMTKMNTTLLSVATDVLTIKETTTELKTTAKAKERLSELETRIRRLEEATEPSHTDEDKKSKLIDAIRVCIQAMENLSKRKNVRLVGLKETIGINGTLLSCVKKILVEGLGVWARGEVSTGGGRGFHRGLPPHPESDQPPQVPPNSQ